MRRRLSLAFALVSTAAILALPATVGAATTASATKGLTVTAPVTASITFTDVEDGADAAVTNFSFAETAPGGTSAAAGPYHAQLSAVSAKWSVSAAITDAFDTAGGSSLADSNFEVNSTDLGAWTDLSTSRTMDASVNRATLASDTFSFRFKPAAGADSGSYSGVITVTAATL